MAATAAIVIKYRLKEAKDLQHKECFLADSDISIYPFSPSLKRVNRKDYSHCTWKLDIV